MHRYRRRRPASQSRIPVEHRQVRIRDSEEGTPARGWAYFTYPARLTPLDTPRKVYTNPLAKSCISCEKGWIYRKNRYNDPEAGLCSGKALVPNSPYSESYYARSSLEQSHRTKPRDKMFLVRIMWRGIMLRGSRQYHCASTDGLTCSRTWAAC